MSHRQLFDYLKLKKLKIDIEGNIIPTYYDDLLSIVFILASIVFYMDYIMEMTYIPYYPITLYSTNLYSKFAEQVFILNNIDYQKIYHPVLINPSYYNSTKKKTIDLNPNLRDFSQNIEVPFIPLSEEELNDLSQHTTIDKNLLSKAQEYIIHELPSINAYHIVRENYLNDEEYKTSINVVTNIKEIKKGLYLVQCEDFSFYTNIILTDYTYILQPGEIVTTIYTNESSDIFFDRKYIVNEYFLLESLQKKLKESVNILPCYCLDEPRTSLVLHPYHLPKSKDFILSIMIIVQTLIMMFQ